MPSAHGQVSAMRRLADAHPDNAPLRYNLGVALQEAGDIDGARVAYERTVRLAPNFYQAWNNLGLVHEDLKRYADSAAAYRAALSVKPDYPSALRNLGRVATAMGDRETLRACHEQLARLEPDNWRAHLGAALTFPGVHVDSKSIAETRQRLAQDLKHLGQLAQDSRSAPEERLRALDKYAPFLVAYQGEDDRELQLAYARLVRGLLGDVVPEQTSMHSGVSREMRLRVAFASSFFRDCTVGHYFKSWITDLNPDYFEVWVFLLEGIEDELTIELRKAAYRTVDARGSLPAVAKTILDAAPDILIYPELGMNGRTYALASLRLAPVQCVAWGHPVTSGHATIDYFISCAAMEPADGASHYAETLIGLPGLGTRYELPVVGEQRGRRDFDLPESANLYFFPHAPYKVHPENDAVVAEILAGDQDGYLVLCEGVDDEMNRRFLERLRSALTVRGLSTKRLILLPHMSRSRYLELNRLCDVMIDTTRWSGGNTSLDALAAGLPVVTRRGRFMRGRQTAAMLELMGISELIVEDEEVFIHTALRLGRDKAWREHVSGCVKAGQSRLFDDQGTIRALEKFLLSVGRAVA